MAWKLGKRLGHCVGFGSTELKTSVTEVTKTAQCRPADQLCDLLKVKVKSLSHANSVTPWTVACQAPLSMAFSMHEY